MENKNTLTGPVITGSFEKRAPWRETIVIQYRRPSVNRFYASIEIY